jgi:hypothetical protein
MLKIKKTLKIRVLKVKKLIIIFNYVPEKEKLINKNIENNNLFFIFPLSHVMVLEIRYYPIFLFLKNFCY